MKNVNMILKGNLLTIVVDLTKSHGDSKSGKTEIIASTEGNANVKGHEGVKVGLNVYRSKGGK